MYENKCIKNVFVFILHENLLGIERVTILQSTLR